MKEEIIIAGAIRDSSDRKLSQNLVEYLKEHVDGVEYYKFDPGPGFSSKSAVDWMGILGSTADVFQVANTVWCAYKYILLRHNTSNQESATVSIMIKNERNEFSEIVLGPADQTEEGFVREFTQKVDKIRITGLTQETAREIMMMRDSNEWKRQ